MERRFSHVKGAPVKVRAKGDGDDAKPVIEGYAAVFFRDGDPGTEYWIVDDFVERILDGAFDDALQNDDIRGLFNHDPNLVLGRSTAETLRLSSDKTGLRYEIDAPDTQASRDVQTSIARGDVSGSSFAFLPTKTVWREEDRDGKLVYVREIESVQLFDVGPVTYPAYDGTSTGVRCVRNRDDAADAIAALEKRRSERAALSLRLRQYDVAARMAELNCS